MIRNSNSPQQLRCSITGGNPLPALEWSCYNGTTEAMTTVFSNVKVVTWIAGSEEGSCICTAKHRLFTESRSVSVKVIVICK